MRRLAFIIVIFFLFLFSAAHAEEQRFIVKLKDTAVIADEKLCSLIPDENIYIADANTAQIFEHSGLTEYIEPDIDMSLLGIPYDFFYSRQWQVQMMNADYPWSFETYGNEIKIAVIDSGCVSHEDISDNLLPGYNYIQNSTDVTDTTGHGSHVCGIIAAQMNSIGISGIAPRAKIVPLKCFSGRTGSLSYIISAIYDAVDVFDCRIINMSFGAEDSSQALEDAIDYAYSKGAILFAAVGNDGNEIYNIPAAYNKVIGVGSIGLDGSASWYSQRNDSVAIVTPGEDVISLAPDYSSYVIASGTSMSTPFACGAAALALSFDNTLTQEALYELLISSADDLGAEGYDTSYGWGLLNLKKMTDQLLSDVKFYQSPINVYSDYSEVLLYNNSTQLLNGYSILPVYYGDRYIGMDCVSIALLPGKKSIRQIAATLPIKALIWEDYDSMLPLCSPRSSN